MTAFKTLGLTALAVLTAVAASSAAEPEQVWQDRCARCHGDMSRFAERTVCMQDAVPILRQGGEALEVFLADHGRLSRVEIEAVCKGMAEKLDKPLGN